eukprot:2009482-Amphidinium_carterae.1
MESMLKKHLAVAQDSSALQQTLKEALSAVQQQKREVLSLSDQQAHFCAQIRALSARMDQQTKIVEEANAAREKLKEELITVYVRLDSLPSEELVLSSLPPLADLKIDGFLESMPTSILQAEPSPVELPIVAFDGLMMPLALLRSSHLALNWMLAPAHVLLVLRRQLPTAGAAR